MLTLIRRLCQCVFEIRFIDSEQMKNQALQNAHDALQAHENWVGIIILVVQIEIEKSCCIADIESEV